MICGEIAPKAGLYVPPSQKALQQPLQARELSLQAPPQLGAQQLQPAPQVPQQMPPPQQMQPPPPLPQEKAGGPGLPVGQMAGRPRFCNRHDSSEKRIKSEEPSLRECQKCKMQLHTNHKEFMFCPGCSEQLDRCMLC